MEIIEKSPYYPKYRSRYEALLREFCTLALREPCDVLDIGGGQLGLLAKVLWGDRVTVSDIGGDHLDFLREQSVRVIEWNLCADQAPFNHEFDFVFFSEVIEHLPIPGHQVLQRIRTALRMGGTLICSTPNLYRPRNIVYMMLGKRIFDYFRSPTNQGLGHIVEYDRDHLRWQFERAGFQQVRIDLRQFPHRIGSPMFRVLGWLGSPIHLIPRFRDNLVAVARNG